MRIGWETEWNLAFLCISALQEKTEGQRARGSRREREDDNDVRKTGLRAGGRGINEDRKRRKMQKRLSKEV